MDPVVESAWIAGGAAILGVVATGAVAAMTLWFSRSTNKATLDAAKDTTDKTVAAAREAQVPDR